MQKYNSRENAAKEYVSTVIVWLTDYAIYCIIFIFLQIDIQIDILIWTILNILTEFVDY